MREHQNWQEESLSSDDAERKAQARQAAWRTSVRLTSPFLPPLVALGVRAALDPFLLANPWFLLYPAVFVSSWIGGRWAGALAGLFSVALAYWFLVPPLYALEKPNFNFVFPSTILLLTGILFSVFHQRLRHTNAQLTSLFEQASDGILVADGEGRYLDVNNAACRMLGYTRSEMIGMNMADLVPPEDSERVAQLQRDLVQGGLNVGEWNLRHKDGTDLPVEASATILPDGRRQAIIRDIRDRKQAQLRLEQLRKEWTAIVAHDLRQPATVIAISAELLPSLHAGALSTQERALFNRIEDAANRLQRMINDLLDATQLETHQLSLKRRACDMGALVSTVVNDNRALMVNRAVTLTSPPAACAYVDPDRMHQVLTNLFSNAAKYARPGTPILVDVKTHPLQIEVAVCNEGPGIAPHQMTVLFSRFGRTSGARTGDQPGLGLGLYIAYGIVHGHGGRMWASSVPDGLTSFHFTVPRSPASGIEVDALQA
jgi:PAS domain S-box-containing protein